MPDISWFKTSASLSSSCLSFGLWIVASRLYTLLVLFARSIGGGRDCDCVAAELSRRCCSAAMRIGCASLSCFGGELHEPERVRLGTTASGFFGRLLQDQRRNLPRLPLRTSFALRPGLRGASVSSASTSSLGARRSDRGDSMSRSRAARIYPRCRDPWVRGSRGRRCPEYGGSSQEGGGRGRG